MQFTVVIPARLESTRLPRKVLADICGHPMIYHTYQQAIKSGANRIVIATDSDEVCEVAQGFGATVCMTRKTHLTGTDRINEVCEKLGMADDEIVVNLQADEPMIDPSLISKTAEILDRDVKADVATLGFVIRSKEDLLDPHVVKVVLNKEGHAMYFSRAPIPWDQKGFADQSEEELRARHAVRHVGIYAYRAGYLKQYVSVPACTYERLESLEQLRVLWSGGTIGVEVLAHENIIDVNTQRDLELVREMISASKRD
jgi:3-deoxy-manno-octulosonate cytidylyltransferase (CMP-KDO synthetase)